MKIRNLREWDFYVKEDISNRKFILGMLGFLYLYFCLMFGLSLIKNPWFALMCGVLAAVCIWSFGLVRNHYWRRFK